MHVEDRRSRSTGDTRVPAPRSQRDVRPAARWACREIDDDHRRRATLGACKAGQRPGDMTMPNGQTMNIRDMRSSGKKQARSAHRTSTTESTMAHNLFDSLRTSRSPPARPGSTTRCRAREGRRRQDLAPAGVDPHRARIGAAQLRRQEGHRRARARARELERRRRRAPTEIPFVVARIVLQDFTGVPLLVRPRRDAQRRRATGQESEDDRAARAGRPRRRPLGAWSTSIGAPDALELNLKLEFQRNRERYQFLKWGMQAFDTFKVVPPGIGIVHQVNLEYLARGVHREGRRLLSRHARRHRLATRR